MDEPVTVFTPGEAARRLGVTTQSLRRYADDYGEVFDPIPVMHRQRVFDDLIVARIRAAQELFREQVVPSIKAGLERVRDGDVAAVDTTPTPTSPFEHLVLQYLEGLTEQVSRLAEENAVLHKQLGELRQAPELPPQPTEENAVRRAVEAEKMNRYLLGELERRRLEAEQQPVRRWRWPWSKSR